MYLFITVCLFLFLGGGWGEILFFRYDEVSWKQTGSTFFFFVKELERKKKENCQSVTQIPPPPSRPSRWSLLSSSLHSMPPRPPLVVLHLFSFSRKFYYRCTADVRTHTHTQRYTNSQRPTRWRRVQVIIASPRDIILIDSVVAAEKKKK